MNSLNVHTLFFVTVTLFVIAEPCQNGNQLLRKDLDRSQQEKIVALHNSLRNKVASGSVKSQDKAQNMRVLSWDTELAAQAQKWAENCKFEHDPNLRNKRGEYVGQNLAVLKSTSPNAVGSPDLDKMQKLWFDEVYEHGYKNDGTFQYSSGHYSQMIWADTTRVGCGYSAYKEGKWYSTLLVCNYYQAGNFVGQKAYQPGARNCKKFNLPNSRKYNSLCG